MVKFLAFLIIFNAVECNPTSKADNSSIKPAMVQTPIISDCSRNLEEKIKPLFNNHLIEEGEVDKDEELIKDLKSRLREETLDCLVDLQTERKDDFEILAKTSYLLIKLGHNEYENGKILVSSYLLWKKTILSWYKDKNYEENYNQGKYNFDFGGDLILSLIADVIKHHNKEILSETIDLADDTDGASSEVISHIFGDAFEKNPQDFLRRLKPKSKEIREDVYLYIYYSNGKAKAIKLLSSIPENSDVYSFVKEIKEFARTNKYISEMNY